MLRQHLVLAAAAALAVAFPGAPAHAAPIATFPVLLEPNFAYQSGSSSFESGITYSFWVAPFHPLNEIGSGFLMAQFNVTAADLGRTFVASALNMGAAFTASAAELRDGGLSDYVSLRVENNPGGGGYGYGSTEAGHGIDLRGQTIGSLMLIVDEISIDIPGSNPNRNGRWTDIRFNGRLVFDSDFPVAPTPEPATLALFGAGIGLLSLARRRPRA